MAAGGKKGGKPVAFIDPDSCTGCAVCLEFRPVDPKQRDSTLECIFLEEGTLSQLNGICAIDQVACVGCTQCVLYCPWEAIQMVLPDGSIQPTIQATGYLRA